MKPAKEHVIKEEAGKIIPLFGKDEMNLIEFPFGPIRSSSVKTLEVEHQVFDRTLKREVTRRMIITGSDAFGLPRPIDDQVLLGMKTLTHEAACAARKVEFSRYHLCKTMGWVPDGRAYQRLEESFDRIAGTTLKFKDAWWDKGEREWKSKTFHLIEEVDLCSRDRLDRTRAATGRSEQKLCSFIWTEVIWKSFQDGFIKTLDMQLFRKIAQGRRREVPLRLFRILDKRFHYGPTTKFDLRRLCIGTLGLCPSYSPSQMARVLDRAAKWLIECEYLEDIWYGGQGRNAEVSFRRRVDTPRRPPLQRRIANDNSHVEHPLRVVDNPADGLKAWLALQSEKDLFQRESEALNSGFGSELERRIVAEERSKNVPILSAGRIRQQYVHRFITPPENLLA